MMIAVTSFISVSLFKRGIRRLLLIAGLMLSSGTHAASPDLQLDVGYSFDDNVTHTGGAGLADRSYSVNLSQAIIFPLADHERAFLTGSLDSEVFDRNRGLNRLSGAVHGELQYRSSAEFATPTFALFAKIATDQYQSSLRDGYRYTAGVSLLQTLTDRIRLFSAVAHNQRTGNNAVFDNKDNSARIDLDYSLKYTGTMYLGGEYRCGDVVISGSEFWSANNSNAYTEDDAFSGGPIYSYRFDGSTVLATLGYNLGMGSRSSFDFSWRRAVSSVSYLTPGGGNATLSYVINQYSVAYLQRF